MPALDATDLQRIAKERYGVSGTVWHVTGSGNDSTGDGLSWIAPYATARKASTVAAAGDLILVSGTTVETLIVNLQAGGGANQGISIIGVGAKAKLGFASLSLDLIRPGNRSLIQNLAIVGTSIVGFQFPIGLSVDSGASPASDVVIEDCYISAASDGIYEDVGTCLRWKIRRTLFESKWDTIVMGATNSLDIDDSALIATGPAPNGIAGASTANATACSAGGITTIRRSVIRASGSLNGNVGLLPGSPVRVSGSQFSTSGTGALDMSQSGGASIIDEGGNSGSGTGGALVTSGTITRRRPTLAIDQLPPIDGMTFDDWATALAAVDFGKTVPAGATVAFKKRDGATTKVLVTYGGVEGERTGSVLS